MDLILGWITLNMESVGAVSATLTGSPRAASFLLPARVDSDYTFWDLFPDDRVNAWRTCC